LSVPRIALVTCATLPDLDPDDQLLIEPMRDSGVDAVAAVWDDPGVDWSAFDLIVIRSTWDYPARRREFLEWTRRVGRLVNAADVIEWNTDKGYLRDLASVGVPVVPTSWVAPHDEVVLPPRGRHVLKPAVGAGSLDAEAFSMHDDHEHAMAREHASRLLAAGQTVMVQPYLDAIDEVGETALMFFGGKFSHAVGKQAMLAGDRGLEAGGLYKKETIEPRQPTDAQLNVASRALAAVPGGPYRMAYARVDLVPDSAGNPLLIELELTEPSLFLRHGPGSAARFARSLAKLAGK
jgi:hypothetical protein